MAAQPASTLACAAAPGSPAEPLRLPAADAPWCRALPPQRGGDGRRLVHAAGAGAGGARRHEAGLPAQLRWGTSLPRQRRAGCRLLGRRLGSAPHAELHCFRCAGCRRDSFYGGGGV